MAAFVNPIASLRRPRSFDQEAIVKGYFEGLEEIIAQLTRNGDIASTITAISGSITTTGDQILICTNTSPIVITLNANPRDAERVIVKRQNTGAVSIAGNGNNIDGSTPLVIGSRYDAPTVMFTNAGGEWSVL